MRYHLILPFIGYLFRKMFSGVFTINRKYRREMESNPGLALFIGAICSILFVAFSTLGTAIALNDAIGLKYGFTISASLSVCYVLYTFFSTLFNDFLEERQELFDVIKDDRAGRRF